MCEIETLSLKYYGITEHIHKPLQAYTFKKGHAWNEDRLDLTGQIRYLNQTR